VRVLASVTQSSNAAVVSFLSAALDAGRLVAALYDRERIGVSTRGGDDRAGIRGSPPFYTSPTATDRLLETLRRYLKTGA
jgi:hypothetical protein